MSTSNNGLDAFERSLRESLDQFEVPYNSSDWAQMERSLNGNSRSWWASGVGLSVLIAGLVVAGGGAWYALQSGQPEAIAAVPSASAAPPVAATSSTKPTEASSLALEQGNTEAVTITGDQKPHPTTQDAGTTANSAKAAVTTAANAIGTVGIATKQNNKSGETPSQGSAGATVTEKPAATAAEGTTFRASVAEGCPGTSVDFKVTNMPEDGIYLWNFGDGSFSNQANPEHTFAKPGSYQVMLSMSSAGVGTIHNKPSSDVIVIHEAPMAAFNVLKQEYDGHLPSVHFENRSLAGKQYHWDFGDGQTSTIPHPDHIYKKKGVYQVELTVTNEIGCEDKIMKDVRIEKDYNLDAQPAFSPNGDDFQEGFMPEALRTLGVKFMLTVYAPNGTLLYQTNDASKPWTGRPQNRGDLCAPGEYVWVVDVRESLHLAETYTGKVKLER
jgi:PKD repeat protein